MTTPSISCVGVPKAHYDELQKMFDAGEEVSVTDRWGQSSKLYRKDGKIYDPDRLNGTIDFDREVVPMPSEDDMPVLEGPSGSPAPHQRCLELRTNFAKLLGEYGPPKETTRMPDGSVMHVFEKDGRGWRYIVRQGMEGCMMLPL